MERLIKEMHLNVESSRKNATDERLPTFRNPELLKHTEQLISSASTVLGSRSTVWGGSDMEFPHSSENGQPLDRGQRATIEDWIPHLASMEEEPPQTSDHHDNSATSDTLIDTYGFNLEEVQSTESDSDDDHDIVKKCFERAKKDFSSDQHAKALEFFRAGIKRAEKLGLKKKARLELRTIQMEMGFSLLSLGELGESEQRLLSVARAQTNDDKGARLALHASSGLAQIFLCKRAFAEADEWCRKSRIGWKRVGGRGHPAYVACLRLSAFSSELQGDHTEAVLFEEMANDSKAAPAAVDTGLDAYESLGFTIEKSRILVTEYHKKVPDTTRKEASTKSRRFIPGRQASTDPINGPTAQPLAESPIKPNSGTTAVGSLHDAARKEDTGLIKRLLKSGADIEEAAGENLERPLYLAALHNNISAVKCLLDRGANIEAKNKSGYTAFTVAAWEGHKSIVECLLDYGANIEARKECDTALMKAASAGHKSIINCLLDRGANIEVENEHGNTALAVAAWDGHKSIVECLLDHGANMEAKNRYDDTALMKAASKGHKAIIECLLDRGANMEVKNEYDDTALTSAAWKGHKSTVECLLDYGANIEVKSDYGNTALTTAARDGHKSIVECLLDRGANIESKTNNGNTALILAAWKGHKSTVECLVDRGANIEATNPSGETALLLACRLIDEEQNKSEIVQTIELLCSRGVDVSVKDDYGQSPLTFASEVKDSEIREELISVLKKHGAKE